MLGASAFPFIAVLCNNAAALTGSSMAMLDRIEGLIEPEDLMNRLTHVLETHGAILTAARLEIQERETDRQIREEQDRAFEEALLEDQERERKQREEERRLEEEREAAEREAEMERNRLQDRERRRELCKQRLGTEPPMGAGVTQLAIRLTDGSRLQRRFRDTDKLQVSI
jgi:FAS-associated factor 2